jgi:polyphosphate:AMP phosphotransferase
MQGNPVYSLPKLTHVDTKHLRLALVEAQWQLRRQKDKPDAHSVLVLVSGIELAGKGEAITQLREWADPRLLMVKANMPQPVNTAQPFWKPYAPHLPAKGQLVVLFGNWYGDLLAAATRAEITQQVFDAQINLMRQFERDLAANGTTIIKCWFDVSWTCLQQRLDGLDSSARKWQNLHGLDWRNKKQYEELKQWQQRMHDDWFVIQGEDIDKRNLQFAHLILDALTTKPLIKKKQTEPWVKAPIPVALLHPSPEKMEKEIYQASKNKLQKQVAALLRKQAKRGPVVIVFEGMDAAGKGDSIRRLVEPLDPREYEIHSIAAPEPFEQRHSYLWRFMIRMPELGGITIFDRSWYGRVLVERVEGLISDEEWQRAYDEINRFEHQLIDQGYTVVKFWLSISEEEQLKRFEDRQDTPHKRFKITDEDWRNRSKWQAYLEAAADMLARTNQSQAPWHVIASNDKYSARVRMLEAIVGQLSNGKELKSTS